MAAGPDLNRELVSVRLVSRVVCLLRLLEFSGPQLGLVVGLLPVQYRLGEDLRTGEEGSIGATKNRNDARGRWHGKKRNELPAHGAGRRYTRTRSAGFVEGMKSQQIFIHIYICIYISVPRHLVVRSRQYFLLSIS